MRRSKRGKTSKKSSKDDDSLINGTREHTPDKKSTNDERPGVTEHTPDKKPTNDGLPAVVSSRSQQGGVDTAKCTNSRDSLVPDQSTATGDVMGSRVTEDLGGTKEQRECNDGSIKGVQKCKDGSMKGVQECKDAHSAASEKCSRSSVVQGALAPGTEGVDSPDDSNHDPNHDPNHEPNQNPCPERKSDAVKAAAADCSVSHGPAAAAAASSGPHTTDLSGAHSQLTAAGAPNGTRPFTGPLHTAPSDPALELTSGFDQTMGLISGVRADPALGLLCGPRANPRVAALSGAALRRHRLSFTELDPAPSLPGALPPDDLLKRRSMINLSWGARPSPIDPLKVPPATAASPRPRSITMDAGLLPTGGVGGVPISGLGAFGLPPAAPPGGSRAARAAAAAAARRAVVEPGVEPNTVIVLGQRVELRAPKHSVLAPAGPSSLVPPGPASLPPPSSSAIKRVNSIRKSFIKFGSFGKEKDKDKEKDHKDKDPKNKEKDHKDKEKDHKDKEKSKSKKEKERVRLSSGSSIDSQMKLVIAPDHSAGGSQAPTPPGHTLIGILTGQKTPELRSPPGGSLSLASPTPNAQKRISGPTVADAEQLQKFSAQGLSTIQQMLQLACQEYEAFKLEYARSPTEQNYSNMEQQGKIVKRLETQANKQRGGSVSCDTDLVSPNVSSGFSDMASSDASSGWRGGVDSPSLSLERRPTGLPPVPPGHALGGGMGGRGHRKVESMGGMGLCRGSYDPSGVAGGAAGVEGTSLHRSHSDSYKRRLLNSENTLRATASTDELEKLRALKPPREGGRAGYKDSRPSSHSQDCSDDASDPASDRLSPLRELGAQESYGDTSSLDPSGGGDSLTQWGGGADSLTQWGGSGGADSSVAQTGIMSMEDGELSSDEDSFMDQGVFSSFAELKKKPAHLAVFLHYLLSNCDPSSLLFYLVTESYPTGSLKEMRKWAYEIFATFLIDKAALRIEVEETVVESIHQALLTKFEKDDIMKNLFKPVREVAQLDIEYLLDDYRTKRKIGLGSLYVTGLGSLYGDHELKDFMDHASEMRVVESALFEKHFERLLAGGEENERHVAIASALATFFRQVGYSASSTRAAGLVERCTSFNLRDKTKLMPRFSSKNKKVQVVRGHHFSVQQYYSLTYCHVCQSVIGAIGTQSFQCTTGCEMNVHKHCLELVKEACTGKKVKPRPPSMFNKIIRKPSVNYPVTAAKESKSVAISQEDLVGGRLEPPPEEELDSVREGHVSRQIENFEQTKQGTVDPRVPAPHSHSRSPEGGAGGPADPSHEGAGPAGANGSAAKPGAGSVGGGHTQASGASLLIKPAAGESGGGAGVSDAPHDSDMETEADLPPLESVIGKEAFKKLKPKEKKRQDVINELFYTERAHVRNLKLLQRLYCAPMRAADLPPDFVSLLFPNIDDMVDVHGRLNAGFKAKRKESSSSLVGDFAEILVNSLCGEEGKRFQRVCSRFCEKQAFALETLKSRQRKDPKLAAFLLEVSNNPLCRRLELKDFLPTAMQRLTKYPLLIESLLKYTQHTEEYTRLQQADVGSRELLSRVNEAVQLYENHQRLVDLQRRIDKRPIESSNHPCVQQYKSLDLTRHRLLHDGALTWRISRDKLISLHAVLLNDILLLLQKQDSSERLVLRCQSMFITQGREETKMTHSPIIPLTSLLNRSVATDKRAFFLVFTSSIGPQIYDLVAGSRDEKNKWCKYITDAVEAHKASNQTPVYDNLTLPSRLSRGGKIPGLAAAQPAGTAVGAESRSQPPTSEPVQQGSQQQQQGSGVAAAPSEQGESLRRGTDEEGSRHVTGGTRGESGGPPGGAEGILDKAEDDLIPSSPIHVLLDKFHQLDARIFEMIVDKARLRSQLHQAPHDDYQHILEAINKVQAGAGSPDRLLAPQAELDALIRLVNECLAPPNNRAENAPEGGVGGGGTEGGEGEGEGGVVLPVSRLIGIMGKLQRQVSDLVELVVVKDEDNARLHLELQLAQKQFDNLLPPSRPEGGGVGGAQRGDSRPLSMASGGASSGDELMDEGGEGRGENEVGGGREQRTEAGGEESEGEGPEGGGESSSQDEGASDRGPRSRSHASIPNLPSSPPPSGPCSPPLAERGRAGGSVGSSLPTSPHSSSLFDLEDSEDPEGQFVEGVGDLSLMLESMRANYEQLGALESALSPTPTRGGAPAVSPRGPISPSSPSHSPRGAGGTQSPRGGTTNSPRTNSAASDV